MKILAIETSCDDTGIAILESKGNQLPNFNILSNIVSSQIEVHKKWGGVYPTLAKREHQKNLVPVLKRALCETGLLESSKQIPNSLDPKGTPRRVAFQTLKKILKREEILYKRLKRFLEKYRKPEIAAIAITVGPGLEPCLWVGVNFAKALAYFWKLPIIPVNHIEAHIVANFIRENSKLPITWTRKGLPGGLHSKNIFPAICLVVSGGHTQLILMKNFGQYKILGETRDDAAGECFDKVAKILGLEYPGGPAIASEADKFGRGLSSVSLPRPMINQKNYDFSFSGLKTAVLYDFKKQSPKVRKSKEYIQAMSKETQQAVIDVLIRKTLKAAKNFQIKTVILGGGVTANTELRRQFQLAINDQQLAISFLVPPKKILY